MDGQEQTNLNMGGDEKFLNFRPCLFLALFIGLGIVFARWSLKNGVSAWWCVTVFVLPPLLFAYFRKKNAFFVGLALSLCFVVGVTSYTAKAKDFTDTKFYNAEAIVYGRVINRTENSSTTRLVLADIVINGKAEGGKLVAYLPTSSLENLCLSDLVFVQGIVQTKTDLFGKNATFHEYFADDIRFVVNAEKISVTDNQFDVFADVRDLLRARLYAGMGKDAAAVSLAVLTGDSSGIEDCLLENVRRGGIAHIFAVSGLHIGTLYAVCIFLIDKIKFLRGKKAASFCLVAIVLLFYGGVCGFAESVLRAIVMSLTLYASKLIGVKRDGVESVSLAAILVLLINPVSLFCVGFQLSFAACYGICVLSNPLQHWLEKKYRAVTKLQSEYPVTYLTGERGKFFGFLSVSVSAQVATAPILLNAYGYLSVWGALLNFVFVPCVGTMFSVTLACSALACLLPSFLSTSILWLPNLLWTVGLLFFEAFEFSVMLENVALSGLFLISYYSLLIVLSDKFNLKSNEKIAICLIFALVFVCAFLV